MARRGHRGLGLAGERGQASLLLLGMLAALIVEALILFGFGQALGARGKHQRAADLAAVSAAQVMSRHYQRLFEPAVFENGLPNPRHLSNEEYLALARAAALRGARRNGVAASRVEVGFPAGGFAPTRIEVSTPSARPEAPRGLRGGHLQAALRLHRPPARRQGPGRGRRPGRRSRGGAPHPGHRQPALGRPGAAQLARRRRLSLLDRAPRHRARSRQRPPHQRLPRDAAARGALAGSPEKRPGRGDAGRRRHTEAAGLVGLPLHSVRD